MSSTSLGPRPWTATKFETHEGRVTAGRGHVYAGSILSASLTGQALHDIVRQHSHGDLVDVGCGSAPAQGWYQDRVRSFTRIDWSATYSRTEFIDIWADLSFGLPCRSDRFDVAICSDVLEHLRHPDIVVAELARVLRPGGVALVTIPFLYPVHEAPHDYQRFTSFGLEHLFTEAGFEVRSLESVGGSLDVLADLAAKHLAALPLVGDALAAGLAAVATRFGTTGVGAKVRARTGIKASLGYVAVFEQAARVTDPAAV